MKKEAGDQDTQIEALLTPDQKADHARYRQERAAHYARSSTSAVTAELQSDLNLTSEQADRAFAALYQVTLEERTGKSKSSANDETEDQARWRDRQTKAIESILTPTQLESYRQVIAAPAKNVTDTSSKTEGSSGSK